MRTPSAIFSATTLIAAIVAANLWMQLRVEREQNAQLQARVAQMESAQVAPQPVHTVPSTASTEQAIVATPSSTAARAPVAATAPSSATRSSTPAMNVQELMKDPDFRDGMAGTVRSSMSLLYPDLAKDLGLTNEQASKLLDLLAKHQMAMVSLASPAALGDEAAMREAQKSIQENSRKQESEISTLLGENKYQQWKEYQSTLVVRQQVSRLHSALEASGQALEDDQEKSLITALAADQKRQSDEAQR
jgi:hypothetical protein